MKGKITIVLLSLALVFGMIAASCDNGDFPDKDDKDYASYVVYENDGNDLPKISTNTDQPIRLSAADVKKKVEAQVKLAGTQTLAPEFELISVAYNPAKHAPADSDNAKLAAKYAGLKIFRTIVR
jgi:hypothetical protein